MNTSKCCPPPSATPQLVPSLHRRRPLYQNLDIIRASNAKYVLVLSGDHIYQMDYGTMLAQHTANKAKLTVSCIEVPLKKAAGAFGVMTVDDKDRILRFEKPEHPTPAPNNPAMCLASMGNYVFDADFLLELLERRHHRRLDHDFGKDIIPPSSANTMCRPFASKAGRRARLLAGRGDPGCLLGSQHGADLSTPSLNLYDHHWPIWTYQTQLPPPNLSSMTIPVVATRWIPWCPAAVLFPAAR